MLTKSIVHVNENCLHWILLLVMDPVIEMNSSDIQAIKLPIIIIIIIIIIIDDRLSTGDLK